MPAGGQTPARGSLHVGAVPGPSLQHIRSPGHAFVQPPHEAFAEIPPEPGP